VRRADDLYRSLVSEWRDPAALLQPDADGSQIQEPSSPLDWPLPVCLSGDAVAQMMATDTLNYLPNDILTKVDRAAMAASLETRAPFLDHRVAAVTWRLPMAMKIHPGKGGGTSKWALRQILYKHVPRQLIERPKACFGTRSASGYAGRCALGQRICWRLG
jgi:asparagine synthase (glutamine-hydrolysing)